MGKARKRANSDKAGIDGTDKVEGINPKGLIATSSAVRMVINADALDGTNEWVLSTLFGSRGSRNSKKWGTDISCRGFMGPL